MADRHLAHSIIQSARTASLGTLTEDGTPFVSLVTVAATSPTSVVMLLSGLAKHTKNLIASPECSLLLVEPGVESGDPLQGARLTVIGTARQSDRSSDQSARATYLAAHPSAEVYAGFGDFHIYEVDIREAHLVAGFGRIETLIPDQL